MRSIRSPLDGFASPFGRRASGGAAFSVDLTGLSTDSLGTYGQVGNHAAIGYTATQNGSPITLDAVKWSASSAFADAATFGTGENPTAFTAADGFSVYLHGQKDGEWVTRSFTARKAPAVGGADLDLSFGEDSAITATNLIANWTANGNTLTFVSVSPTLPTGLSISSAGAMTGTPTTVTADATYTLTMEDEYGREVTDTFTLQITEAVVLVTEVTQGDTTFTFSKGVQAGQYWNGDWWVVADPTATITSVTPNSVDSSGRILHGLMKDPYMGAGSTGNQGFDSAPISGQTPRGTITYASELNIDPTITATPVTLTEGSYVKAESIPTITGETRIKRYTVLTVVPSAPAANAFRPGIRAASKVLNKTTANIDWTLRRNISGFTPVADLTSGIDAVKRLQWTWAAANEAQRGYYPNDGLDVYGADWGNSLGSRMLAFHGDYSQAQLEETVHSIVQIGIDLIAGADDGLEWSMQEGHHVYRKFPALMAALLLDDTAMKATVNYSLDAKAFGNDDDAHYYITQTLIDNSPNPAISSTTYPRPYLQEHLGMPEWGSAANTATFSGATDGVAMPELDARYRVLNGLSHIRGAAWVYATAGAEALCNPAMLDYWDRMAEILEGDYTDGLYSVEPSSPAFNDMLPFSGNWGSTPFGSTRLTQYKTLRAFSARPTFVNVPEEMPAPALTAETDGTVTVAPNATNPFLAPRAATSAISSYQLRWRPITNLTGTSTPDASVPWQVITGIGSLPYVLSGVPGNTEIRVQLRAVNAEGTGIWLDDSPEWIDGVTVDRYAARVTTHNAGTAPQNVKAPVLQIALLGEGEIAHADPGIWVGNPAPSIAYQHQRSTNGGVDWTNITDADSQDYTIASADVGNLIRCAITATNATGSTTVNTASRSIVASPTTAFTPTVNSALFEPIWHYAARSLEGSGFAYGQTSASLLDGEDGALRLKEVSGANFDNVADVEVLMEYELSAVDRADAQIILRGGGDNNEQGYILGYTRATNASSTDLFIERLENGVRTRLGTTLDIGGAGIPINTRYSIRAQAEGTNLRVKYWLTSNSEPGTWGVETTDATYASGFIGTRIPPQTITRIYKFDVTPTASVADVTAPTLSSPTDAADGATASTGSVSTNEANGTLYWVVTTSATSPSAAQVKAGNDHTGTAATDSGSQSVGTTGVQTLSPAPSGLTAATTYYTHFMHEDAAANPSTVSSADGFTTGAAPAAITLVGGAWASGEIDSTAGTTAINFAGTAEENDVVIILRACDQPLNLLPTSGSTAFGSSTASNPGFRAEYIVLGASPGTSVAVPGTIDRYQACLVGLFRGVDTTTPIDATITYQAITTSNTATPPAIDTATNGAWVVALAAIDDVAATVLSYPSGYLNTATSATVTAAGNFQAAIAAATKEIAVAGPETPGTFVWSATDDTRGITFALRPA